jgi:hypothetical protein
VTPALPWRWRFSAALGVEAIMVLSLVLTRVALLWSEMSPARARCPRDPDGLRRRRAVGKVCAGCEKQRARFRDHGVVTWDRYYTLCQRCFRTHADALRGRHLAGGPGQ